MRKIDLKVPPWCPFCGQAVEKPQPPEARRLGEMPVGTCKCGAVYTSDATGHNVGAAMVDALVHSCNDNWDLAWELLPQEDYLTGRIENYDEQTHQVVETRKLDGRVIRGVLYFVRLHGHAADIVQVDRPVPTKAARPVTVEPARDPKRVRKRADKGAVKKMAQARDIDGLVDLCLDDKRTLRFLQRLLFDPDEAARWQTADVIGAVCARVSTQQPGTVSDLLHRLFEACSDSASTNWGAVEAIGSIIADRPDIFGSFARHLLGFLNDPIMGILVVWAFGTIAEQSPEVIRKLPVYHLFGFLDSPVPALRGGTLRLLGRIRAQEVAHRIEDMVADETALVMYEKGRPVQTTVGRLAREAVALIRGHGKENAK
jgi:hypothetical protein